MFANVYELGGFILLIVVAMYLALRLYISEQVLHGLKEIGAKPEKPPSANPLFSLVGWALLLLIAIQAVNLLLAQTR